MFHDHHSECVDLRTTAEYTGVWGHGYGVLLSGERLRPGEKFVVKIENTAYVWTRLPLALGVTTTDPGSHPQLPELARELRGSWVVEGGRLYQDGKKVGDWEDELVVGPGDRAGVTWTEDGSVYISRNDRTTLTFTGVPGPVWALTDVWGGVSKISVIPPVRPRERPKGKLPPNKRLIAPSRNPPPEVSTEPLTQGLHDMALGGGSAQFLGPSASVVPRDHTTTTVSCPYWQVCDRFIGSLGLPAIYFEPQFDTCFCGSCIASRGDDMYYTRGQPPKLYGIPNGWARFGLSVPVQAHALDIFKLWHVAYHGTIPQNLRSIIDSQSILMPGDYTIEGKELTPPPGHFTDTRKPRGFDIRQVFVSPTITYAGHRAYARPYCWLDRDTGYKQTVQVVLQLRIKPDSYQVGPETLGLQGKVVDAKFKNTELEWSTKIRGATIPVGILVKSSMY